MAGVRDGHAALDELVRLSRDLGRPELDYVMFGEGNTSLIRDKDSFWVKASGHELRTVERGSFVAVRTAPVLQCLDDNGRSLQARLAAAVAEGSGTPSTEVILHALALTLGGAEVVAHTHPTPVLAVLCSADSRLAFSGRLFPDEVIICGRAPAYVPYTEPGLPLARAVREALLQHRSRWGELPKVILLENHGMIALGRTPAQVLRVTGMMVKVARTLLGTLGLGGPRFLDPREVDRLASYVAQRQQGDGLTQRR